MATAKVAKSKGLKGLIGKQVNIRDRYSSGDDYAGPFTVLSIDPPFVELEFNSTVFWWNVAIIEGIREVTVAAE